MKDSILNNCFISRYCELFSNYLQKISPHTRDQIRKNKELDELYDLFLDFILDSSQHLDEQHIRKEEKNIDIY